MSPPKLVFSRIRRPHHWSSLFLEPYVIVSYHTARAVDNRVVHGTASSHSLRVCAFNILVCIRLTCSSALCRLISLHRHIFGASAGFSPFGVIDASTLSVMLTSPSTDDLRYVCFPFGILHSSYPSRYRTAFASYRFLFPLFRLLSRDCISPYPERNIGVSEFRREDDCGGFRH